MILTQGVATGGSAGLFVVDAGAATSGPASDAAEAGLVTWSTDRGFSAVTIGDTDFDGADNFVAGVWTFGLWNLRDLAGMVDESSATGFLTYDGDWLTAVAPAGDFDADGRADLALLADDAPKFTQRGQVALCPGSRTFGGSLDFSTMPYLAQGGSTGDSFGYLAGSPGDFDMDGAPDLLVAAPGAVDGAGAIYVLPFP